MAAAVLGTVCYALAPPDLLSSISSDVKLSWWQLVKTGVISPVQSGLISLLAAVFGAT